MGSLSWRYFHVYLLKTFWLYAVVTSLKVNVTRVTFCIFYHLLAWISIKGKVIESEKFYPLKV